MADPIAAWHQDHVRFQQSLALLQQEIDRFHTGDSPDYQRMLEVIDSLRKYGDTVHHPREDEAFRRLLRYLPDRDLTIARLHQEHRVIAHAGDTLRSLLFRAANDGMIPRAEIEVAAATYLVYYGNHIAREEEDVLPRAAHHLTQEDWNAVRRAGEAPLRS